jgi:hypothetical protein
VVKTRVCFSERNWKEERELRKKFMRYVKMKVSFGEWEKKRMRERREEE